MSDPKSVMPDRYVPIAFPGPEDVGPRPWGTEEMLGSVPGSFTFKRLKVRAGQKGGLQFHRKKNEMAYLVEGRLLVRYQNEAGELASKTIEPGGVVHFPPGSIHQEEALDDCLLIEVSTPFLNDRVRVEQFFGLEQTGLPSTSMDEIKEL